MFTFLQVESSFYEILMVAVSEHLNTEEDSVLLRLLQAVAVPVLGNVCHVFMNGLNRVQVSIIVPHTNFLYLLYTWYFNVHFINLVFWYRCMVWRNYMKHCYIDQRTSPF